MRVPIASPRIARGPKCGSSQYPNSTPATIDPRLKKLEAIAGMPNTLRAFSMPITSAASDTSRMNGYMTLVRVTVSAALSASNPGASAATSQGAVMTPSTVIALRETAVRVATLSASRQAAASFSSAAVRVNTVTNAVDSAPSANRSRSRFGMRKAMVNASMTRPPPKRAAKICSRARPSTRLQSTASPTTPAARVFSRSARLSGAGGAAVSPEGMRALKLPSAGARRESASVPDQIQPHGTRPERVGVLLRRIGTIDLTEDVVGRGMRVEQVVAEGRELNIPEVHAGAQRGVGIVGIRIRVPVKVLRAGGRVLHVGQPRTPTLVLPVHAHERIALRQLEVVLGAYGHGPRRHGARSVVDALLTGDGVAYDGQTRYADPRGPGRAVGRGVLGVARARVAGGQLNIERPEHHVCLQV